MANTLSAKKRSRQTPRRTARNYQVRSKVRTAVTAARVGLFTKDAKVPALLKDAISALAKAANKGTLHKRNAARRISRLMKAAAAAKTTAPAAKK